MAEIDIKHLSTFLSCASDEPTNEVIVESVSQDIRKNLTKIKNELIESGVELEYEYKGRDGSEPAKAIFKVEDPSLVTDKLPENYFFEGYVYVDGRGALYSDK